MGFVRHSATWRSYCLLWPRVGISGPIKRRLSGAMFQQRVNALTGESEWVLVSDEPLEQDIHHSVTRSLAESLYLDMLNDRHRNSCFNAAIQKLARKSASISHILDIGAGTGLLSLMAYRAMKEAQKPVLVTSCESYLPMFKLARKIFLENSVEPGVIRLLHMRSDEIRVGIEMPRRANALVCEILDSELLGEGVIPSLRHAHEHLLEPGSPTVPHRATMFAQLVECEYLWRCHDLEGVEAELQDGLVLSPENYNRFFKYSQYAFHADALPEIKKLSEPFQTFTIDFYKPPATHDRLEIRVDLIQAGTVHAIISWWVLQLDEEGLIQYSTAPHWIEDPTPGRGWSDHWKQCIWFTPGRGLSLKDKSSVSLVVSHDEASVSYQLGAQFLNSPSPALKISPERTLMLGDTSRRAAVQSAVQKALQKKKSSSSCIVLDDSLLCAACALAHAGDSGRVFAMFPGIKHQGFEYLKGVKGLSNKLTLLSKEVKRLTSEDFKHKKVDVVLAEPYYAAYEKMLPWKPLRFWYERTLLNPLLSEDAFITPCRGVLCGMAYYMPDLWKSRCSLEEVEGFNHSSANKVIGACGNLSAGGEAPLLPFSIWQCGEQQPLTKAFSLLQLDFNREIESVSNTVKVSVSKAGVCHGIVLWMDWVMDSDNELVLSTGPLAADGGSWKQGVKLLGIPRHVFELQEIEIQARFDVESGDVSVYCSIDAEAITF